MGLAGEATAFPCIWQLSALERLLLITHYNRGFPLFDTLHATLEHSQVVEFGRAVTLPALSIS